MRGSQCDLEPAVLSIVGVVVQVPSALSSKLVGRGKSAINTERSGIP